MKPIHRPQRSPRTAPHHRVAPAALAFLAVLAAVALPILAAPAAPAAAPAAVPPITLQSLLAEMADPDAVARFPIRSTAPSRPRAITANRSTATNPAGSPTATDSASSARKPATAGRNG